MCISVLIVNWNSKELLRNCLRSVGATCGDLIKQVVVVDAGSFDGSEQMLAAEFPHVEFVQSFDNQGFGRSNNLGFKHVKEEYLLLLNPDTELRPQAVAVMLAALQSMPDAGIVSVRLLNTDGSLQTSCVQALPTPINQALDCEFLRRLFPGWGLWGVKNAFSASKPVEVEAVSGACMLLRSETFQEVGGFSSDYFMYGEDMDLCAKVRRLGFKVYHVPNAEVIHLGGGTSHGKPSHMSAVMMRVAIETYMKLNRGTSSANLYRILQGVSAIVRLQILLPVFVLSHALRRKGISDSIRKWFHILMWCIGACPNPTPCRLSGLPKAPSSWLLGRKGFRRGL